MIKLEVYLYITIVLGAVLLAISFYARANSNNTIDEASKEYIGLDPIEQIKNPKARRALTRASFLLGSVLVVISALQTIYEIGQWSYEIIHPIKKEPPRVDPLGLESARAEQKKIDESFSKASECLTDIEKSSHICDADKCIVDFLHNYGSIAKGIDRAELLNIRKGSIERAPWCLNKPDYLVEPPPQKPNSSQPSNEKPGPAPEPTRQSPVITEAIQSDKRIEAMRHEAELWRTRMGLEYHDFSQAKNAITEDDKKHFNDDDRAAWDILSKAESIIAFGTEGINSKDRYQIPINISLDDVSNKDYGLTKCLYESMSKSGYKISKTVNETAFYVKVSNVVRAATTSGQRFQGSAIAQWDGTADTSIRGFLIGRWNPVFGEELNSKAPARSEEEAEDAAIGALCARSKIFLDRIFSQN